MDWLGIGELAALTTIVGLLLWASLKFGPKPVLIALLSLLPLLIALSLGLPASDTQQKWSEAKTRMVRNYSIIAGFGLLVLLLLTLAFYFLKNQLSLITHAP